MDTLLENPNLARNPSYRLGLRDRAVSLESGKVSIMSRQIRSARFSLFFRNSEPGRSPSTRLHERVGGHDGSWRPLAAVRFLARVCLSRLRVPTCRASVLCVQQK